ncbi:MAG: Uma2 family endonuclease [Pseudomonadota bacterium]
MAPARIQDMVPHTRTFQTPRAPTTAEWEAMSPEERARVVDSLPAAMLEEERALPEGDPHFKAKTGAMNDLELFFRRLGRRIYIACDLTVYYPGEQRFAPDLLAVRDVDPHDRMKWVVSAEGKGLDFVMEVLVAGDRTKDLVANVDRYARLGIPEYFIYDRGRLRLTGYRLDDGEARDYKPIVPHAGRLESEVLGLDLVLEEGRLRFYYATAPLLGHLEIIEHLESLVVGMEASADARLVAVREEALREGREEERKEGLRRWCRTFLEAKLGPLSAAEQSWLAETDPATLERLLSELGMAPDVEAARAALARAKA